MILSPFCSGCFLTWFQLTFFEMTGHHRVSCFWMAGCHVGGSRCSHPFPVPGVPLTTAVLDFAITYYAGANCRGKATAKSCELQSTWVVLDMMHQQLENFLSSLRQLKPMKVM